MKKRRIKRVAVIDDDDQQAQVTSILIEDAGLKPQIIQRNGGHLDDLVTRVCENSDAAVCDHRLRMHWQVQFDGAEVVAALRKKDLPAILVTQYFNMDTDVSIRRWRPLMPVVLRRDDFNPDRIRLGLAECTKEIRGSIAATRRPHRTIIRVDAIGTEAGEQVIDAIIPAWKEKEAVRFPASLIPDPLRQQLKEGLRLIARVNIGAKDSDDLYFTDFEIAPEPNSQDGLT